MPTVDEVLFSCRSTVMNTAVLADEKLHFHTLLTRK
jgi:hypothetical protein